MTTATNTTASAEVVNLTSVAKMLHASTPNARMKLDKAGLVPVSEIEMPGSGRKYTLYRKTEALEFVQKVQNEKNPPVKMNPKPQQQAAQGPDLAQEVHELKGIVLQLVALANNAAQQPHKRTRKTASA